MPDARALLSHFMAGQLAALAWLGALSPLDLQLACRCPVSRRDANAPRGHLLDRAVALVAIALGVLAALAGITQAAEPIHRDRQRRVRLAAGRAVRHRCGGEAPGDRLNRLDLVERYWIGIRCRSCTSSTRRPI